MVWPVKLDHIENGGPGSDIDPILRRHAYPRCVAMLLGEALTLAVLVQSLLKADGRLIVQAQGQGLVPLLVAEMSEGGALRGYARLGEGERRPRQRSRQRRGR